MIKTYLKLIGTLMLAMMIYTPAGKALVQGGEPKPFTVSELIKAGHHVFDAASSGFAYIIEENTKRHGLPNAYIVGEEGSVAFIGGLRYGEGTLHTRDGQRQKVFWQGPTVGWDFGADGNRMMILVYNLHNVQSIFRRFPGITGSAYFVGGLGMTVMKYGDTVLVPVRSGIGARAGVNVGYLKVRDKPTWNPF